MAHYISIRTTGVGGIVPQFPHNEFASFDFRVDGGAVDPDWDTSLKVDFFDSAGTLKATITKDTTPALVLDDDGLKYVKVEGLNILDWAVGNVVAEVSATVLSVQTTPYPFSLAAFEILPVVSDCVLGLLDDLELRWRFSKADNFLNDPSNADEQVEHIYDALDEINSEPPQTFFTMDQVCNRQPDPRWRTLLLYGAAKNITTMITNHQLQESLDASIDDLSMSSKYGDYQGMLSELQTQFTERLAKLKDTSQRFAKGISGANTPNILNSYSITGYWSRWR